MIIWLASCPKSGNTWVRLFLDSLFFRQDRNVNINNIKIKQFLLRKDFYGLTYKIDNVNEFIENCEFDKLNKQETSDGLREETENIIGVKNKFFSLGPKNNWKKLLSKEIKNEIEILFKKEMLEIGYL